METHGSTQRFLTFSKDEKGVAPVPCRLRSAQDAKKHMRRRRKRKREKGGKVGAQAAKAAAEAAEADEAIIAADELEAVQVALQPKASTLPPIIFIPIAFTLIEECFVIFLQKSGMLKII